MRLKESEHYLGTLSGAAAPYRYTGCVRSAVLRAKYQGEPWTAVELGVEMARLLFGSEILMRGAEPTPQRVQGLSLGYDCHRPGAGLRQKARLQCAGADGPAAGTGGGRPAGRQRRSAVPALAAIRQGSRWTSAWPTWQVPSGCMEPDNVDGKRVLLVDDVITTGATAAACAQALLDAGAQSVFAVALATVEFDALPSRSQPIAETAEEDEKEIEKT